MEFTKELIAPCGINCGVCIGYLRDKNKCGGCMSPATNNPTHCYTCRIKLCPEHDNAEFIFCHECPKFPCARIKRLHKRYLEKYDLDLIANHTYISNHGLQEFIRAETEKWKCRQCGAVLCVHRTSCLKCGNPKP